MRRFLAVTVFLFPAAAECQSLPALDVLLDRLDAYARQYQATLPSLSCDEQIISQALNKKGKVTWESKVESTLREIRTATPDDPFQERRQIKRVDGRRPRKTFRMSQTPYFVEGGFASLVGFKRWEERDCFDYDVTPGHSGTTVRLEMTLKTEFAKASCAKLPEDFHRIVIADPATGRVLHTERTISPDMAARNTDVYFGGIDYAPQTLGAETFWLPLRFAAHDAQNAERMVATYSNCHRFAGELKILPDMTITGAAPH